MNTKNAAYQDIKINAERLLKSLQDLGQFGALPHGGTNRLALTDEDKAGRDWTVERMKSLGMTVHIDAIGNGIGTYPGLEDLAPVMIGSHIDTVRTGGLYDGNYGVMSGLEVVAALKEANLHTKRPISVAFFTNEEGARFQPDMLGSLVYVNGLSLEEALSINAIDGPTVGEELTRIGYAGTKSTSTPIVDSYVELHIEQGPILDQKNLNIGVVEGVQGICWMEFTFKGNSNHAGTTPMSMRKDAGIVAMKVAAYVDHMVEEYGDRQLGTIGSMVLKPNLVNVIAQEACMTIDLRNTDKAKLNTIQSTVIDYARTCAEKHGITFSYRQLADFDPVEFNEMIVNCVEDEAKKNNLSTLRMPSGAGHDAQMLARICPAGMIFVPSVNGLSHNIKEFTHPQDLANGTQVLLQVVTKLANR